MTPELYEQERDALFPDELVIASLDDAIKLHSKFIEFRLHLFLKYRYDTQPHYRGEQNYGWNITPGLFRPPLSDLNSNEGKILEQKAMQVFERTIIEKVGETALRKIYNHRTYGKSWDLLFQAQHAGIKTSLTDWSADIVSPLFFATERSMDENIEQSDAQLWWLMDPPNIIHAHSDSPDSFYEKDPFALEHPLLINPVSFLTNIEERIFEYRMFKQKGRFLIPSQDQSNISINKQETFVPFLRRIRVPSASKEVIRNELAATKTDRAHLYVDENPSRQTIIDEINHQVFGQLGC